MPRRIGPHTARRNKRRLCNYHVTNNNLYATIKLIENRQFKHSTLIVEIFGDLRFETLYSVLSLATTITTIHFQFPHRHVKNAAHIMYNGYESSGPLIFNTLKNMQIKELYMSAVPCTISFYECLIAYIHQSSLRLLSIPQRIYNMNISLFARLLSEIYTSSIHQYMGEIHFSLMTYPDIPTPTHIIQTKNINVFDLRPSEYLNCPYIIDTPIRYINRNVTCSFVRIQYDKRRLMLIFLGYLYDPVCTLRRLLPNILKYNIAPYLSHECSMCTAYRRKKHITLPKVECIK